MREYIDNILQEIDSEIDNFDFPDKLLLVIVNLSF